MPNVYDAIDMKWTWNGDYSLGHDGDLSDTSTDVLLSLLQDIHDVCASAAQDWELLPNWGAQLDDFIGEPNVRSRADQIHDRIRLALTNANVVAESDLQIKVVPVHRHKVMVLIAVQVVATANNQMEQTNSRIRTALVFDFVEQGMLFWDKIPEMMAT